MSRYALLVDLHPHGADALSQARAILATHGFTDGLGGLFVGDDLVAAVIAAQEIARAFDVGAGSMKLLEFNVVGDLFKMAGDGRAVSLQRPASEPGTAE